MKSSVLKLNNMSNIKTFTFWNKTWFFKFSFSEYSFIFLKKNKSFSQTLSPQTLRYFIIDLELNGIDGNNTSIFPLFLI